MAVVFKSMEMWDDGQDLVALMGTEANRWLRACDIHEEKSPNNGSKRRGFQKKMEVRSQ
jgi:hypothetical protein